MYLNLNKKLFTLINAAKCLLLKILNNLDKMILTNIREFRFFSYGFKRERCHYDVTFINMNLCNVLAHVAYNYNSKNRMHRPAKSMSKKANLSNLYPGRMVILEKRVNHKT